MKTKLDSKENFESDETHRKRSVVEGDEQRISSVPLRPVSIRIAVRMQSTCTGAAH